MAYGHGEWSGLCVATRGRAVAIGERFAFRSLAKTVLCYWIPRFHGDSLVERSAVAIFGRTKGSDCAQDWRCRRDLEFAKLALLSIVWARAQAIPILSPSPVPTMSQTGALGSSCRTSSWVIVRCLFSKWRQALLIATSETVSSVIAWAALCWHWLSCHRTVFGKKRKGVSGGAQPAPLVVPRDGSGRRNPGSKIHSLFRTTNHIRRRPS
jgi:hypothetical protein